MECSLKIICFITPRVHDLYLLKDGTKKIRARYYAYLVYILSSLVVTTRKSTEKSTGQNAKYCGCLSRVPPKARKKNLEKKYEKKNEKMHEKKHDKRHKKKHHKKHEKKHGKNTQKPRKKARQKTGPPPRGNVYRKEKGQARKKARKKAPEHCEKSTRKCTKNTTSKITKRHQKKHDKKHGKTALEKARRNRYKNAPEIPPNKNTRKS